jgi:hypothetical protein
MKPVLMSIEEMLRLIGGYYKIKEFCFVLYDGLDDLFPAIIHRVFVETEVIKEGFIKHLNEQLIKKFPRECINFGISSFVKLTDISPGHRHLLFARFPKSDYKNLNYVDQIERVELAVKKEFGRENGFLVETSDLYQFYGLSLLSDWAHCYPRMHAVHNLDTLKRF